MQNFQHFLNWLYPDLYDLPFGCINTVSAKKKKKKQRDYAKPSCLDSNRSRIVSAAVEKIVLLQTSASLMGLF